MKFDSTSSLIIGCAIEVHKTLGPGLLESTYEQCLAHELKEAGLGFELQKPLPVDYKGSGSTADTASTSSWRAA
jgi:GxxExxY protein